MLTPDQIANLLLRAQALQAEMARNNANKEYTGDLGVNWRKVNVLSQLIQAVSAALFVADYSSASMLSAFGNLTQCVGSRFATGVAVDPEAQIPGVTIIINTILNAQANYDRIKFGVGGGVNIFSLSDFQATYVAKYGDNAIVELFVTVDNFATVQEDTGTVPTIVNIGGDVNKPDSYTWTWGMPTTGYVQITGFVPQGANIVSLPITNASADLLSSAELNALYPAAKWGQLILLPNVPCKYEKLDNSPTGSWDYQIYSPNA